MAEAKQITVDELKALRKANPKAVVIDVRDDDKWEAGHIPGAKHLHKSKIAEEIAKLVPDKKTKIVCHCGGGTSGPRAAAELNAMGYKNAVALKGGYRAYKASEEKN